ncbi:type II secretion system protein [Candidatus Solincola tengchongensis]|uniref:pilus assembly FimT family protein n=1 Tax=Candidatus Solincola tengchongensis TaxID=2900693 RepID=UPI0025802D02|nr:type II secretion system protein [Candidatus Solincola tengchongensis]
MGRFEKLKKEAGFTIVELAAVVIILGIILLTATVSYANSRKGLALRSAVQEVERAINRARSIAGEEGVDVYLQFWDSSGAHPNQYTIYRVYPGGVNERDEDTPTETPFPGSSYLTDGNGHYWFKLAEGAVQVQSGVTLLFRREGSVVRVSTVPAGGSLQVTLVKGDLTATVSCNELGEVI